MSLGKKFVLRALLGIPIGIAICATFSLIINVILKDAPNMSEYQTLDFYVRSYIASVIIGVVNGGCSVVWNVEKWGWHKQSGIYFGMIFITFIICAMFAGWVELQLVDMLIFVGIFIAIYVLISIIFCVLYKRKLRKINAQIEKKQK